MIDVNITIPVMPPDQVPPERVGYLDDLLDQLEEVAWARGRVVVSMHTTSREDPPNAMQRGLLVDEAADWVLYIEDDAELGEGFRGIPRLLGELPREAGLASFFTRVPRRHDGWTHCSAKSFAYTVCVALHADLLRKYDIRSYAEGWYAEHLEHYHASDLLFADYVTEHERTIYIYQPVLVQHRPGPSSFKGRAHDRRSPTYRGRMKEEHGSAQASPTTAE